MRHAIIATGVGALLAVTLPSAASAEWSRARLMSTNGVEQALIPDAGDRNIVTAPAISGDGRFVAFWTPARNLLSFAGPAVQQSARTAVLRRQIDGGGLELVAITQEASPGGTLSTRVAMSDDGRFVAFATARDLDGASPEPCDAEAEDCDGTPDVYVRDMAIPADDPAAYRLATPGAAEGAWELPNSQSLSGDGQRVVARAGTSLVVRDLAAGHATVLTDTASVRELGAVSLSGDGSTAVWVDADPRARAAPGEYLPGELPLGPTVGPLGDEIFNVTDLLWRRVDEPVARRVAAAGDAEDPACPAGGALAPDSPAAIVGIRTPCDGVFRQLGEPGWGFNGSTMDHTGRTVAFTTTVRRRSGLSGSDVFVRAMGAGGGRKATTREVTGFVGSGAQSGLDLSADGRALAFTATNDRSALAAPTFVSAALGEAPSNVYVADLETSTIERVTSAYTGEPADAGTGVGSLHPMLSGDGRRIAFASTSTNLLFGDSNVTGDVFVADRFEDRQAPLPQVGAASAPSVDLARATEIYPVWRLGVSVSRGGSTVYVDALVPGRGTVTATARASRKVKGRKRQPVIRTGRRRAAEAGKVRIRLRLPVKYRKAARRSTGLPVRVTVQFRSSGGATLTERLDSKFRSKAKKRKRTKKAGSRKRTSSTSGRGRR